MGEGVVAGRVERIPVVPELHGDVVATEGIEEPVELARRCRRTRPGERGRDRALAAPGQHHPVPAGRTPLPPVLVGEVLEGAGGPPLLGAGEVGLGHGPAEAGIPGGIACQDDHVGPRWVRDPRALGPPGARDEGELRPEDRRQTEGPGGLGETDHPVEPVVIGEGEGVEPEARRLGHQFLGMGGTVEEAEVGVAVQLGVGGRHRVGSISRRPP